MLLAKSLTKAGYKTINTTFRGNDEPAYSHFQKPNGLIRIGYDYINDKVVIRYHYDTDKSIGFMFNSRVIPNASLNVAETMRTINSFETIAQTLKSAYDAEFHNK